MIDISTRTVTLRRPFGPVRIFAPVRTLALMRILARTRGRAPRLCREHCGR